MLDRYKHRQHKAQQNAVEYANRSYEEAYNQYLQGNITIYEFLQALTYWKELQKSMWNKDVRDCICPQDFEYLKKIASYRKTI